MLDIRLLNLSRRSRSCGEGEGHESGESTPPCAPEEKEEVRGEEILVAVVLKVEEGEGGRPETEIEEMVEE